jgi:hypothetical protein
VNQQPVYRLSGDYFGYLADGCLFDQAGEYVGWLDGSDVWRPDGAGEPPPARAPRPAPAQRPTVVIPPGRGEGWGRPGYADALDGL